MSRDNYIKAVRFETPDYIPMYFHINSACWNYYPHDFLDALITSSPFLFSDYQKPFKDGLLTHPEFARKDAPFTDPWGCIWKTTEDGIAGTVIDHPLQDWDHFEKLRIPNPDLTTHWGLIDWNHLETYRSTVGFFKDIRFGEIGHGHTWLKLMDIRGYENLIRDMSTSHPMLNKLIDIIEAFNLGLVNNYLQKGKVEILGYAEDLGMQIGPLLTKQMFQKYIKPSYQRIIKPAREAGCLIHMHSDGDIRVLIDDIIDCQVEIINLQDQVNGIPWIKENLKGKVCIDLDIDRQHITYTGTPSDIEAMIKLEVQELGSREGGLTMVYGLYPGIPMANVKALAVAMERYSAYY